MISIVIPVYNAEKFIRETLESVFMQTFGDYEVIAADDGSTDGSAAIIRSFGSRVLYDYGPNRGVSAARNRGTRLSKGEYIQYLDSDDLLTKGSLEMKMKALRLSGADAVYTDWQRLKKDAEGRYVPGPIVSKKIEDVNADPQISLLTEYWTPVASMLFRRSFVEKVGGWNEELPMVEDVRFLLEGAIRGARFEHAPGLGAQYRVASSGSLSTSDPSKFFECCFKNTRYMEGLWRAQGEMSEDRKKALLKAYSITARASFERNRLLFESAYAAIKKLDPKYVPEEPRRIYYLSKLLGYRNAERAALWYRNIKRTGRPA